MEHTQFDIETAIYDSLRIGIALWIKLKNGDQPIVTAVSKYIDKGNLKLVQLHPYTLYGVPITETVIHLSEIESVMRLTALYDDPVYQKIRHVKQTILKINV